MIRSGLKFVLSSAVLGFFVSVAVAKPPQDSDKEIVQAVQQKRNVNYVEGANMVVAKLLPDDTQGLKHQKWVVRLSNGFEVTAVSNLDMCQRIPIKVGDSVSMGGQFIWTPQGGLVHWLHRDPRGNRPDGYVGVGGRVYCK